MSDGDQGSTDVTVSAGQGSTAQTTTTTQPETQPAVDAKAILDKIEALEKDNKKLRDKLREMRATTSEAAKSGEDEKGIIEELRRKIDELTPLAERARQIEEAKRAAVAESLKALDDEDRKLIEAIGDVDTQERLIARLTAKASVKPTPAPNASPTVGGEVTLDDVMSGKISPQEARVKHPELWKQVVARSGKKSSILAQFGVR